MLNRKVLAQIAPGVIRKDVAIVCCLYKIFSIMKKVMEVLRGRIINQHAGQGKATEPCQRP